MDERLKKDLYNYSETPPERVWENIDAHFKAKGRNRTALFFILALIAISGGLYTYTIIDNSREISTETLGQRTGAVSKSSVENVQKTEILEENHTNHAETDAASANESHQGSKNTVAPKEIAVRKKFVEQSQNSKLANQNSHKSFISSKESLSEVSLAQTPALLIHTDFINNLRPSAENPEEITFSYETPKPCPKVSFFVGAAAGTGISQFMRKESIDPKMLFDYNIQNQPNPVGMTTHFYNTGLSGGILLPKGFFISTGVSYLHYTVKNMSRVVMYPFNSGSFLNSSLVPTATGDVEFEPTVEDLSNTALSGGQIQGTLKQNYGFLNVPLKIGKFFGKRRLQFSLAAGAAFNFKVLENAKFITDLNEEREIKPAALNKINYSLGIEPGFSYRISTSLSLNAGLEVNYTVSNISSNSSYKLNNLLLGLNLGLRWNSKACR
jgi:hypothetical protein